MIKFSLYLAKKGVYYERIHQVIPKDERGLLSKMGKLFPSGEFKNWVVLGLASSLLSVVALAPFSSAENFGATEFNYIKSKIPSVINVAAELHTKEEHISILSRFFW